MLRASRCSPTSAPAQVPPVPVLPHHTTASGGVAVQTTQTRDQGVALVHRPDHVPLNLVHSKKSNSTIPIQQTGTIHSF
jgi:hypothetical protein